MEEGYNNHARELDGFKSGIEILCKIGI